MLAYQTALVRFPRLFAPSLYLFLFLIFLGLLDQSKPSNVRSFHLLRADGLAELEQAVRYFTIFLQSVSSECSQTQTGPKGLRGLTSFACQDFLLNYSTRLVRGKDWSRPFDSDQLEK